MSYIIITFPFCYTTAYLTTLQSYAGDFVVRIPLFLSIVLPGRKLTWLVLSVYVDWLSSHTHSHSLHIAFPSKGLYT